MRGKRFWRGRNRNHQPPKVKDYTEYVLTPKTELRLEVEGKNNKITLLVIKDSIRKCLFYCFSSRFQSINFCVFFSLPKYFQLHSGIAEIFGTELIRKKDYEFKNTDKVNVFTFQGCVIHIKGKPDYCYISKKSPMPTYLRCHAILEGRRRRAEKISARGPIAMVVGAKDVGKSTLCRILLDYATRMGRKPLYVDTDVSEGAFSIPGTLMSMMVERPATIEAGLPTSPPVVFHFGHKESIDNSLLFKATVTKMSKVILDSLNLNPKGKI